eukprot:scaffold123484_cov69-Phaeocystis_antarctica.AAC.3
MHSRHGRRRGHPDSQATKGAGAQDQGPRAEGHRQGACQVGPVLHRRLHLRARGHLRTQGVRRDERAGARATYHGSSTH